MKIEMHNLNKENALCEVSFIDFADKYKLTLNIYKKIFSELYYAKFSNIKICSFMLANEGRGSTPWHAVVSYCATISYARKLFNTDTWSFIETPKLFLLNSFNVENYI